MSSVLTLPGHYFLCTNCLLGLWNMASFIIIQTGRIWRGWLIYKSPNKCLVSKALLYKRWRGFHSQWNKHRHRQCIGAVHDFFSQYIRLLASSSSSHWKPKIQGGRTWQPFVGGKNGHENFRQARIYNFCDKCVFFARIRKFATLTQ